jgi:hypothetical protein
MVIRKGKRKVGVEMGEDVEGVDDEVHGDKDGNGGPV